MKILIKNIKLLLCLGAALSLSSCEDYLDIPAPSNAFYAENTFVNDATTAATLNGVLAQLSTNSYISNLSINAGLYTDEFTLNLNNSVSYQRFYNNDLNSNTAPSAWADFYPLIYRVNAIIEGINASNSVISNRDQYVGEAYFIRALSFYYLTNIYGDIALPVTSEYTVNNKLTRRPQGEAFQQVIADLEMAKTLLPEVYVTSDGVETSSQSRPNKIAAKALLARVLLHTEDWEEALAESTSIIEGAAQSLLAPESVFRTNSQAMIWQLIPNDSPYSFVNYVPDYNIYFGWNTGYSPIENEFANAPVYLSENQLEAFEEGDLRLKNWTFPVEIADTTYHVPYKYQSNIIGEEAYAILRIAEQYLINAEANAHLGNLEAAVTSINAVRNRAGLQPITANSSEEVFVAIAKERKAEFFAEGGYRFFDLKRTNTIDAVMNEAVEHKTSPQDIIWENYKKHWPLPNSELNANPNLEQTQGY